MKKYGFTLIELLAVIAIIAILATVAVSAVISIYNASVKRTMIVQENNAADIAKSYLDDYCFDPLGGEYKCPDSYVTPNNSSNTKYICLSDLQSNEKGNYINTVVYKNEECNGIITFDKDKKGKYTVGKTYLYCGWNDKNKTYDYITDTSLDTSDYPRCGINSISDPSKTTTTATTTTTTKPVQTACTYNGTLKQGAEYVNGQYTYRYMQEGKSVSSGLAWQNITSDGWGVQLTDKASTDAVTSKVCTYINNKPIVSMSYMFGGSKATTLDLSNFDTSNVTDMSKMFQSSKATTLDVSNFDTSNITDMSRMFDRSQATTLDLSNFDTSKVTNMGRMFYYSQATTLDVSNFDTSNVTKMFDMFYGTKATTLDVSNFNTSKVTNMSGMFSNSKATTLDVSNFNTSKVTNMSVMFSVSKATTLDVSNFDTSNVTNMFGMFWNSQATTLDVSNFNTSKVTKMGNMFNRSQATTLDLSNFDTSKVTDMSDMFNRSQATTLDLSNFDTSNVTDMSNMFYDSANLKTIYVSNKFNTDKVTSSTNMFTGSTKLIGGVGTKYDSTKTDKTYARIDTCNTPGYFTDKNAPVGSFSTDSWSKIISNVKSGNACMYKVGDTKNVTMTTYGTHPVRIANISTPSECNTSGFSQTACGFVVEFADIVTPYKMNNSDTNTGSWKSSIARTFINGRFYNALPSDLKSGIISTTVVSGNGRGESGSVITTDKLYLLSTVEVWSLKDSATAVKTDKSRAKSRQLDYYESIGVTTANYSGAIKKSSPSVDFDWWWLRSAYSDDTHTFFAVKPNGDWFWIGASSNPTGISPAFRIG